MGWRDSSRVSSAVGLYKRDDTVEMERNVCRREQTQRGPEQENGEERMMLNKETPSSQNPFRNVLLSPV
ncbi:hypothetical protein AAFF_G00270860 [Aldrovandia affinis]|uniref:Uncharacterized protein n=1 Tax=Aldrovandia affinis TaxID=143900 RepID=A0AAD7RBI9_9TELE|nr:hypothetical protein AAFF_G00270860 [Aldrovandia affinis]